MKIITREKVNAIMADFRAAIHDESVVDAWTRNGFIRHSSIRESFAQHGVVTDEYNTIPFEQAVERIDNAEAKPYWVSPPESAGDYYLFRSGNTLCGRDEINIFRIRSGYLSVDLTQLYSPGVYFFDAEMRLMDGLTHGCAPFLEFGERDSSNRQFVVHRGSFCTV